MRITNISALIRDILKSTSNYCIYVNIIINPCQKFTLLLLLLLLNFFLFSIKKIIIIIVDFWPFTEAALWYWSDRLKTPKRKLTVPQNELFPPSVGEKKRINDQKIYMLMSYSLFPATFILMTRHTANMSTEASDFTSDRKRISEKAPSRGKAQINQTRRALKSECTTRKCPYFIS